MRIKMKTSDKFNGNVVTEDEVGNDCPIQTGGMEVANVDGALVALVPQVCIERLIRGYIQVCGYRPKSVTLTKLESGEFVANCTVEKPASPNPAYTPGQTPGKKVEPAFVQEPPKVLLANRDY